MHVKSKEYLAFGYMHTHGYQEAPKTFLLDAHMETAPASFNVFSCRTREDVREYRLHHLRLQQLYLSRAVRCDYSSHGRTGSTSTLPCAASTRLHSPDCSGSTSTRPCVQVPRHVARPVTRLVVPLVVDHTARPGVSARRAARHAARCAALRRLLRLRRAFGCLSMSRGSSCGSSRRSSLTTLPSQRFWVPRHVARLVTRLVVPLIVDYTARPGASARRAARHAARRAARR
jgi:hypothetical protein